MADVQQTEPVTCCYDCGLGLYDDDLLYAINGMVLCEECLPDFARREYASFRMRGREWREA